MEEGGKKDMRETQEESSSQNPVPRHRTKVKSDMRKTGGYTWRRERPECLCDSVMPRKERVTIDQVPWAEPGTKSQHSWS